LDEIADLVHAAEDVCSSESRAAAAEQSAAIARVRAELECCLGIYERKLKNLTEDEEIHVLRSMRQGLRKITERYSHAVAIPQKELVELLGKLESRSLEEALENLLQKIPDMARGLSKPAPRVIINSHGLRLQRHVQPLLQDIFVHLFRNALDHGLEASEQRIAAGKEPTGTIRIDMTQESQAIRIVVRDDGRGLNLISLEKQMTLGSSRSWDDIAQMIFLPGVSTAEKVSDVSGRGVGMDAVRSFVRQHGGEIELRLIDRQLKHACPFEIIIHLPLVAAVSDRMVAVRAS
jgi:two-component system, chemotaxis family, sensor kinase CheA